LERVGKTIRTVAYPIPRAAITARYGEDADAEARAYASDRLDEWGNPERWRVDRTNAGYRAVLHWWDEATS
jgi:hypothetical protein